MKFKEWNEIAELVGIAAIVGSLIFVGLQMKQAQELANAERRMVFVANRIELSNAINEHADIWLRGKLGQELDEIETVIFENLLHSIYAFHYFHSRAARDVGNEFGAAITLHELAVFLHRNPGAQRAWSAREDDVDQWQALLMPMVEQSGVSSDVVIRSDWAKLDQIQD